MKKQVKSLLIQDIGEIIIKDNTMYFNTKNLDTTNYRLKVSKESYAVFNKDDTLDENPLIFINKEKCICETLLPIEKIELDNGEQLSIQDITDPNNGNLLVALCVSETSSPFYTEILNGKCLKCERDNNNCNKLSNIQDTRIDNKEYNIILDLNEEYTRIKIRSKK